MVKPKTPTHEIVRSGGVTSPTPSLRHVSTTRVNVERGGTAAPMPTQGSTSVQTAGYAKNAFDQRSIQDSVTLEQLHPSSKKAFSNLYGSNDETDSIIYKNGTSSHRNSFNKDRERLQMLAPVPSISIPSQLEYCPTTTSNVEDFDYKTYLPYYLPCLSWIPQYCAEYFVGDLIGGLSLVFFQLPLSISYATSLAHVPITSGLYSLAISPIIYMVFGSVPQMIVGPEGAISLIVGQAVEPIMHHASKKHPVNPMEIVVVVTFVLGASLLGFGLGRFGFLDNVLSASLLKGFICGVGVVMIINSLVVMLGLSQLMGEVANNPNTPDIHSPFDKFKFLLNYSLKLHPLTFEVSIIGFILILSLRIYKKVAEKRKLKYRNYIVYVPEILIVVILSTWVVANWSLDKQGVEIIGKIANDDTPTKLIYNPLSTKLWPLFRKVTTLGFLCAMLGFFESTTASKSLGSTYDLPISSNRELVALGFINLIGSLFGALPAFGGYGRSKINARLAKTTMLGAIMALCTIFTIVFLMDYLHFIPKCTLNVVTCVIGILLIEEAPMEIWFHWQLKGYNELLTFGVTVTTTLFFLMEAGIAVGLIYLLIRVIKHSTSSRIQILGRVPGTNTFLNADEPISEQLGNISNEEDSSPHATNMAPVELIQQADEHTLLFKLAHRFSSNQLSYFDDDHLTSLNYSALEEIEGCLIVKIPEPLTFTNTSDLKNRLKRVEMYGSTKAHPAQKRVRDARMTKYIIFDLNGMTEIDSSAAQILKEILTNYEDRKIYSFFIRVNKAIRLRERLKNSGIHHLLMKDLVDLNYFNYQRSSSSHSNAAADGLEPTISASQQKTTGSLANLTENITSPYFDHISDALKVIDQFETTIEGVLQDV